MHIYVDAHIDICMYIHICMYMYMYVYIYLASSPHSRLLMGRPMNGCMPSSTVSDLNAEHLMRSWQYAI